MERTGASAAHGVRGDRTAQPGPTAPAHQSTAVRRPRRRWRLAALALGAGALVLGPSPVARALGGGAGRAGTVTTHRLLAGVPTPVAARRSTARPVAARRSGGGSHLRLSLVRQSWVVGPGEPFTATVALADIPTGAAVDLQVSIYSPLHTRSGLAEADGGTVPGSVSYRSAEVPVSQLPTAGSGSYVLSIALATPDDPTPATGSTALGPANLDCPERTAGGCGGVYPVTVAAVTASGVAATIVTELVYAYPTGSPFHVASPLRTALVLPLDLPPSPASDPAPAAVAHLRRLASATTASGSAGLPLTLVPEPAAVRALATGSSTDRRALAAMDAADTDPAHEVLTQSYTPVDLTALVQAGLTSLADRQVARACAVLAPWHPAVGTWVTAAPVSPAAADVLARSPCGPVRQLVVAPTSVSGGGCTITCTAPFATVSGNGTALTAATADPQLESELGAPSTDPVLQAHQLVADLSLTSYEAPQAAEARGVVVTVPAAVAVSSTVVGAVLTGLAQDPLLDPVTLTQYFDEVPPGANGQLADRRLTGSSPAMAAATVRDLRDDLAAVAAYGAAVGSTPGGAAADQHVADALLLATSSLLRPVEQQAALRAFTAVLHHQLGQVSVSTGVVRLTSSTSLSVPITLESTAPFPVAGRLVLSSDKLLFTPVGRCRGVDPSPAGFNGLSCPVTLTKATTAVYVSMRARLGGDFQVVVSLEAPDGGLTLAHGALSVRALSASIEAVVLSVAALVVLLTWWARTSWRRPRRGRHLAPRQRGRRTDRSEARSSASWAAGTADAAPASSGRPR